MTRAYPTILILAGVVIVTASAAAAIDTTASSSSIPKLDRKTTRLIRHYTASMSNWYDSAFLLYDHVTEQWAEFWAKPIRSLFLRVLSQ
jgi:hypothetical protein